MIRCSWLIVVHCRDGEVAAAGRHGHTSKPAARGRLESDGHQDWLACQEPHHTTGRASYYRYNMTVQVELGGQHDSEGVAWCSAADSKYSMTWRLAWHCRRELKNKGEHWTWPVRPWNGLTHFFFEFYLQTKLRQTCRDVNKASLSTWAVLCVHSVCVHIMMYTVCVHIMMYTVCVYTVCVWTSCMLLAGRCVCTYNDVHSVYVHIMMYTACVCVN